MEIYANLHTHSTHSDGVYSPSELARIAKAEGYRALAITDHDTASAFPELRAACDAEGLECIFGVEFSVYSPKPYHIVGFDFDPEFPPMKEYLAQMAARQTDNTKACFDLAVKEGGISGITWEEVLDYNKGIPWLCNNHVFNAMLDKGLVKQENYMAWFKENFEKQRGYFPPSYNFKPLPELIKLVKDAGGFCIVAHPTARLDDIDELMSLGIVGLEVLHPDLTEDEKKRALEIALEKGLFISGGSDHNGLCGGYYSSYPSEEELKKSYHYIPEMSVGTSKEFFDELKTRTINKEYRKSLKNKIFK